MLLREVVEGLEREVADRKQVVQDAHVAASAAESSVRDLQAEAEATKRKVKAAQDSEACASAGPH